MGSVGVWCHTSVGVDRATALDRLPARTMVAGIRLETYVAETGQGAYGRHAVSVPVRWSRGRREGRGSLEVAPLASDRVQLLLHLEPPAGSLLDEPARSLLESLRDRLEGRAAPASGPLPSVVPAGRRRVAVAMGLLCVPALVLGLFVIATSPTPVSVDDRVMDFRASQAGGDTAAGPDAAATEEVQEPAAQGENDSTDAAMRPDDQEPDAALEAAPVVVRPEDSPEATGGDVASDVQPVDAAGEQDDARPGEQGGEGLRSPQPGVYRYATTGGERLDVRGSARDYPETTTITVHNDACGFGERWDVFDERWEERHWCLDEKDRRPLVGMTSYREFFGHGQRNEMACEGVPPAADAMRAGTRWQVVCDGDGTTATTQVEVVGTPPIQVEGDFIDTLHLRMRTQIEGETSGTMTGERWIVADTGLLVREQQETEVETAGPVGPVTYTEHYTLQLESEQPAR